MEFPLQDEIKSLMEKNRRVKGGFTYTVPSPEIYPFQWLWDSCFHAIILSYFGKNEAQNELRSVTSHPLPNGLLPHIIYWEDGYHKKNWGRELRGDILNQSWGIDGTSAITQPPIIATALWHVHTMHNDIKFLKELYQKLRTYYLCLLAERDPESSGIVGIINPDESGEDNSPRFDRAQGLPERHTADQNLNKRIDRIRQNRECNFNARDCMRQHFWIKDVAFNAILVRGLEDMAHIANEIGETEDHDIFLIQQSRTKKAMRKHMCEGGFCYSLDDDINKKIHIDTWNLFTPLFGGTLTHEEADTLVHDMLLDEKKFWSPFPIPSIAQNESCFQKNDFWRGPTWIAPNWFIYQGLKRYGYEKAAGELRDRTRSLIERSGFREYYDPRNGKGLGANNFTWGGLIIDMH